MAPKKSKVTAKGVGVLDICDTQYDVFMADKTTNPAIEDDTYGYTENFHQIIALNKHQPKDCLVDTIMHEGQHAIWHKSGIGLWVAKELDITVDCNKFARFEEDFIQRFTPHFVMMLRSMRKLKV